MDFERRIAGIFRLSDGKEFQEDCGIRVHGSAWMRPHLRFLLLGALVYPYNIAFGYISAAFMGTVNSPILFWRNSLKSIIWIPLCFGQAQR